MLRAVAVVLFASSAAFGQATPAEPAPNPTPTPASPTAILTESPAVAAQPPAPTILVDDTCPRPRLLGSFDFLLGALTGPRYQTVPLFGGRWSAEIFGGLAAAILPSAGVGVRRRVYEFGDASNSLCVAPGVDAYVLFWPWGGIGTDHVGVAGAVSFDVDILWTHVITRRFDLSVGVKAGAAVVFGRNGVLPYPLPMVSLYFGCGF